jgi:hypothetical protein
VELRALRVVGGAGLVAPVHDLQVPRGSWGGEICVTNARYALQTRDMRDAVARRRLGDGWATVGRRLVQVWHKFAFLFVFLFR